MKSPLFVLATVVLLLMPLQEVRAHSLDVDNAPNSLAAPVKDINTATESSISFGDGQSVTVGETTYFVADDGNHGAELWKTNRSAAGTLLVKDINPGAGSSGIRIGLAINNTLYFGANNGVNGWELWKTDGSEAGTLLVKDINPGSADAIPTSFIVVNGRLYFTASDGASGRELWRSDGSEAGTVRVTDITDGQITESTSYFISFPLTYAGDHFFFAVDGSQGAEVWVSNGTAAGTFILKDINPSGSSDPMDPVVMGNTLYFVANDGVHGYEVWRSDGTTAGTWMVKDVNPNASEFTVESEQNQPQLGGPPPPPAHPSRLTPVNGTLYFSWSDGSSGYELWKSDGTASGTMRVKDIAPGADSSLPGWLTAYRGGLLFSANGALWRTDGSEAGTTLIASLSVSGIQVVNDSAFVAADSGGQLWITNGTPDGSRLVNRFDRHSGVGAILDASVDAAGALFFSAEDEEHSREPWVSNGTAGGTVMLKDINTMTIDSSPMNLTDVNGQMFFTAEDFQHGLRLWKSDGSAFGTQPLKDVSSFSNPTAVQDMLYFVVSGDLWKSDGTEQGTLQITPATPVYIAADSGMAAVGNVLFFAGVSRDRIGLWKSDGTPEGTTLVRDIASSFYGTNLLHFINIGGTLFFVTKLPAGEFQLWKSDGTQNGTVLLKSLVLGYLGMYQLNDVDGTLFFFTWNSDGSSTLWKSNGTDAGTVVVKNVSSDPHVEVNEAVDSRGRLYFNVGQTLWTSDGTPDSTAQMTNLLLPSEPLRANKLTRVGERLFFVAHAGGYDHLCMADDTGMTKVKTFGNNGPLSSYVIEMTDVAGSLVLLVEDSTNQTNSGSSTNQISLWLSDGTEAGTNKAQDMPSLPFAQNSHMVASGGAAYFAAYDPAMGLELWRAAKPDAVDTFVHATAMLPALPGGVGGILIDFGNKGGVMASGVVVTATLPPAIVYQSDTSGVSPIIQNNTVSWVMPDLAQSSGRRFYLQVVIPDAPLGTQYPVALTITAQGTDVSARDNTATATIKLARLTYLPAALR